MKDILLEYTPHIKMMIRKYNNQGLDNDDLLQEIYIHILRFLKNTYNPTQTKSWISNAVHFVYSMQVRKLKVTFVELEDNIADNKSEDPVFSKLLISKTCNEIRKHPHKGIQRVLFLYFVRGLKAKDISKKLNISEVLVESRIHNNKKYLINNIKKYLEVA